MYHSCFIHSSVDGHLGCFHVLVIVNKAVMNTGLHESFSVLLCSGYRPSSGIAESHGGLIPSCFKESCNVLHSGSINLHSSNSAGGFPSLHTLSSIYCL